MTAAALPTAPQTHPQSAPAAPTPADASATRPALRFITCGSVDDGKSTLIGRLLLDSRAVLQDHLAGVTRSGQTDLALLTDGLQAEREQGITIDVAWRYFATEARKFIIGDAPGHEQYTRNMVTAASQADAAVVLVDATKIDWQAPLPALLPQTRRHALLAHLLRVPSIVFAINKLDAVAQPAAAFAHIRDALQAFAQEAGIQPAAIVPISALMGWNVAAPNPDESGWCGYQGPALLPLLEKLPATPSESALPLAFPVQWVEKNASSSDTRQGRRIFWGRVAAGQARAGEAVQLLPSGHTARIAQVLDHTRQPQPGINAGHSAGLVLDRELDLSRGDWITAAAQPASGSQAGEAGEFDTPAAQPAWPVTRELQATLCWLDDEPLTPGRVYWALHGHRWLKAKARRVLHRLDIHTLQPQNADRLEANAIGQVELALQEAIPAAPFATSRALGALILVDAATHRTAAAALAG